jgi:hypothetical protein
LLWLFGDSFAKRLHFELGNRNVLWSRLVRRLQEDSTLADRWRAWIRDYESLLLNPQDAPAKVRADLHINEYDFCAEVLDVFAEICSVLRLSALGASDFEVKLPIPGHRCPDFVCLLGGKRTAVEVKNLRVHRFAEKVMLDHYYDTALKRGVAHPHALVLHKSTRTSLGRDENSETELRDIVDRLLDFEADVDHELPLASGAVVRFRLERGGDARAVEAVTITDIEAGDILAPEIRGKILRRAKESIPQLYSSVVADVQRRVLAMRWDLPWYDMLRPAGVSEILRADFDGLWASCDCQVEVLIFTDASVELNTILP